MRHPCARSVLPPLMGCLLCSSLQDSPLQWGLSPTRCWTLWEGGARVGMEKGVWLPGVPLWREREGRCTLGPAAAIVARQPALPAGLWRGL